MAATSFRPEASGGGPRTVLGYLPALWSGVLFPGPRAAPEPARWLSLALLVVLPAAVLYPCTDFYLFEPDEGRYAQIPAEMLARGDWLVPTLQGEPYLDKPPLFYWAVMAAYSCFGVHDWAARLVPALAVHATVLLVYWFGCRRLGERAAFWGALALAVCPGFVGMARLLLLDGLLTFLVTLTLLSTFESVRGDRVRRGWWLLAAAGSGLAILTKGPVVLVLTLLPVWLYCRLHGKTRPVGVGNALAYAAVALGLALPWYAAMLAQLPAFGYHFLWVHNVLRYLQPFDHLEPVWFYAPIFLACFVPATLLLWPFARFLLSAAPDDAQRRPPELGFLLLAGGWCLLFFSLSGSKLPTYILPAFPPLALAVGVFLARTRWHASAWTRGGLAAAYAFIAVGNYWLVPDHARSRTPMNCPSPALALCRDRTVPVVCYPRNVDSVAFYFGRDDFKNFRSKATPEMLRYLAAQEKAVVLCGHRHSLDQLADLLPPHLHITESAPLGLCDMAVVQRRVD